MQELAQRFQSGPENISDPHADAAALGAFMSTAGVSDSDEESQPNVSHSFRLPTTAPLQPQHSGLLRLGSRGSPAG